MILIGLPVKLQAFSPEVCCGGSFHMPDETIAQRKDAHLHMCATREVEPKGNSALLECVHLLHCAMPELCMDDVQLTTPLFGKILQVPLIVTGMTGGTPRAQEINLQLAQVAEEYGIAFGIGSQRAMVERPDLLETYKVRSVAPHTVLMGNIGVVQAAVVGVDRVRRLCDAIDADAMAVHLNFGQELTQLEGDRDFRGGYETLQKLVKAFGERLLVKETGCGISPGVARRLVDCGVQCIDVSGLGGTSWVRVEQLRSNGISEVLGSQFSSWGIPTAAAIASVNQCVGPQVKLVASGGIRTGLDVAKVLALGAQFAGMALPLFQAQQLGGVPALRKRVEEIVLGFRQAIMLTGSKSAAELRTCPRIITGELKDWLKGLAGS